MKDGWIKIYRILRDNEIWKGNQPYDKRSAWIDLLLRATHQHIKFLLGNTTINLAPGQVFTSGKRLAKDWKWSQHKVTDFEETLYELGQIGKPERKSKYTILTIVNWKLYQSRELEKDTKKEIKRKSKGNQKETYKNDKKDKNVKKEKREILKRKCELIINYLNEKTERVGDECFDPTNKSIMGFINARLNEGRTPKDFIDVIDKKVKDWFGDEKMVEFLRPSTLFNREKFENYLRKKKPDKFDKYLKKEE